MKDYIYLLGFFLLLSLLCVKEGFINNYEPNKVLSDEPDDVQFYACRQEKLNDNPEFPFEKYRLLH